MQINRYTQPTQWAQYNPMSFQELAFAPTFLRQRHDAAQQGLADLDQASNEYDVLDQFGTVANQAVQPFQKSISELAEQLASQGVQRSQAIPQAMKLKSEYQKLFGQQGAIGQLQGRTQEIRAKQKEIQEFFKDSPELAQYKLSQLAPGEAEIVDGKLKIGESKIPNYVKDIPQSEILDRLDKAASTLKSSDFGDFGIEKVGRLNNFTELVTLASGKGVTAVRANKLMESLLSNEEKASIVQRGELYGLNPEESIEQFKNQLKGIANNRSFVDIDRSRIQLKDDAGIAKMKSMSRLTTSPGPRISRDMVDILKSNGLEFDAKGENIVESKTAGQKFRGFLDNMSVGPFAGWKIINQGLDELGTIIKNADLAIYSGNPALFSLKLTERINSEQIKENLIKANTEALIKDTKESVAAFKQAYPEMANLSNKDAYGVVTEARQMFSELYSDVIAPKDADFTYINRQILGGPNQTGDFERRQVFVGDQKIGTGTEFYKQLGYKNFTEFKEKGQPSMEPAITFGAKTPAAFIMNAIDSNGDPVSATVQSNKEFEPAGRIPHKMLSYIQEGKMFKELVKNAKVNESLNDFGLDPAPGMSMYYMFDIERGMPIIVEAEKGLKPGQVRELYKRNPEDVEITFVDAVNDATMEIFYGESEAGNLLKK
jgi:hypothetical protein